MYELVRVTKPPPKSSPPFTGPATDFFVARLEECYKTIPVRDPSTGRLMQMNTNKLWEFLKNYAGADDVRTLGINTFYRTARGEISPRIDMVYSIAKVFRVPPSWFLPDQLAGSSDQ